MSKILVSTRSRNGSLNASQQSTGWRTQCRKWSMGDASYHCSMRGACSTNWNCCPIDAGNPVLQALPSSDTRPFNKSFAICSPSHPSLIIDKGFICWATMCRQNFSQSKYSSCFWSSILLVVFVMKQKYVVTEVLTLYLVPDSFKHSVKPHVLTLSFFSTKMTMWYPLKSFRCRSRSVGFVRRGVRWKKTRIV